MLIYVNYIMRTEKLLSHIQRFRTKQCNFYPTIFRNQGKLWSRHFVDAFQHSLVVKIINKTKLLKKKESKKLGFWLRKTCVIIFSNYFATNYCARPQKDRTLMRYFEIYLALCNLHQKYEKNFDLHISEFYYWR